MERELLAKSRFFNGSLTVDELLANRYSRSGSQKDFIVLKPTGDKPLEQAIKLPDIVLRNQRKKSKRSNKQKQNPRSDFRNYLTATMKNQKKACKLVSQDASKLEEIIRQYNIPDYQEYVNLNRIWQSYIGDLLQLSRETVTIQQILNKLVSAEYIGSIVRVTESKDKQLINLTGIVLYEFKNYFVIIVPKKLRYGVSIEEQELAMNQSDGFTSKELVAGIRMVEKKICNFKIIIPLNASTIKEDIKSEMVDVTTFAEYLEVLIYGTRFNCRAIDRSNKKFKNHNVKDMLFSIER